MTEQELTQALQKQRDEIIDLIHDELGQCGGAFDPMASEPFKAPPEVASFASRVADKIRHNFPKRT